MRYVFVILISALFAVSASSMAEEAMQYGKQQVVYHINNDNPKAQAGAMSNVQNHINAVGAANLELLVVMHGKGLSLLLMPDMQNNTLLPVGNATEEMQAKIAGLKNQGVGFKICKNTLNSKEIDYQNDLYDVQEADIVPSGVAEIARLQARGYAYIKP